MAVGYSTRLLAFEPCVNAGRLLQSHREKSCASLDDRYDCVYVSATFRGALILH